MSIIIYPMSNQLESQQFSQNAGVALLSVSQSNVLSKESWFSELPDQVRNWHSGMAELSDTGRSQEEGKSEEEGNSEEEGKKNEEGKTQEEKSEREGNNVQECESERQYVCQRLRNKINSLSTKDKKVQGVFKIYINKKIMKDLIRKLNSDNNSRRILKNVWNPKNCAHFLTSIKRKYKKNPAIFIAIFDCLLQLNQKYRPSVLKAGQAMILVIRGEIIKVTTLLGVKDLKVFQKSTRLNENR